MTSRDGLPEQDIEVTPEMIEAGVNAYEGFHADLHSDFIIDDDLIRRKMVSLVFSVMLASLAKTSAANRFSTNGMAGAAGGVAALVSVMAVPPYGDGIVYVSNDGGITFQARGSK